MHIPSGSGFRKLQIKTEFAFIRPSRKTGLYGRCSCLVSPAPWCPPLSCRLSILSQLLPRSPAAAPPRVHSASSHICTSSFPQPCNTPLPLCLHSTAKREVPCPSLSCQSACCAHAARCLAALTTLDPASKQGALPLPQQSSTAHARLPTPDCGLVCTCG